MLFIFFITFTLSFCSIVYELLLGQTLSAFLGNTVLRYSITIGLYMFSMGIGAFLAEGKVAKKPALNLIKTELLLVFIGGLSVVHLHILNIVSGGSPEALSFFSHLLIILVGVLTGLELPLLMEIYRTKKSDGDNVILGISYSGAFTGSLCFAFIFYPKIGLVPSALFAGVLNGTASLFLLPVSGAFSQPEKEELRKFIFLTVALLVVVLGLLIASTSVNDFLVKKYISI